MKKIFALFTLACMMVAFGSRVQAQCDEGATMCSITILAYDSYGDGWEGSVNVYQGNVLRGTVTLETGTMGELEVSICTGEDVRVEWVGTNQYNENSVSVLNGDGTEVLPLTAINEGSYSNPLTYDLVTFTPACPSCIKPQALAVSDVSAHTATFSWVAAGEATEWRYYCGTSMIPADNAWQTATTSEVTVSGLDANTEYVFMVYSYCGEEEVSVPVSINFRTDCAPNTTLPLVEGFESNGSDIPFCWRLWETATVQNGYYGETTYPLILQAYSSGYGQVSGYGAIELNSGNGDVSFITPRIPLPVNEVEVGFWLAANSSIQVGYTFSNDPANADFHLVAEVTAGMTNTNTYPEVYNHEYVVLSFDTVTSVDTAYVVFRKSAPYINDVAYIDDITIRHYNPCSTPQALHVTATEVGSVSLAWTGDETGSYEVVYGPEGFNPDEEEENIVTVEGLETTIVDLEDAVYEFYVHRVCAGGSGYWAMPVLGIPNMVLMPDEDTLTVTGCGLNIVDNGGLMGEYSGYSEQMLVIMPEEGMTVHLTGSYNLGESMSFSVYAGVGTDGMLLESISTSWDGGVEGTLDVMSQVGPMTIVFSTNYYTGEGFAFHAGCEELPSCIDPYGIAVSNITGSSATITWNYPEDMTPDSYVITLNEGQDDEQQIEVEDGEALSYTLTDLAERTAYTVALAAICNGEPSGAINTGFITRCLSGGEWEVGDGEATNSNIPTYTYWGNTLSQQIFLNAELEGHANIYGLSFDVATGSETRQIDVYMDTTSIASYESEGYVAQTTEKRYFSGALTFANGLVEVNFDRPFVVPEGKNVLLTVSDHTNSWVSATHSFKVSNTASPMAIYSYRDNSPYDPAIDVAYDVLNVRNNVVFMVDCSSGDDCVRPTVTDIAPTSSSITLTWTPGSTETAWKVEYAEDGSTEYEVAVASTNATTYTITDLESQTTYSIRVTSLCGDAMATRTVTGTTLCGSFAVPLVEDFTGFLGSSYEPYFEPCWDRWTDPSSYSEFPYAYSDYLDETLQYLYFGGYQGTLIAPTLSARLDSLSVSFDMECTYNYGYDLRMEFGIVSNFGTASEVYMPLDTFKVSADQIGEWITYTTDMDLYSLVTPSTTGRLYFRSMATDNTQLYFDNLNITRLSSCRVPDNVQVGNITPNTATFTITDSHNDEGTTYTLYYGTSRYFVAAEDSVTFSGNSVTIEGLTSGTCYWAWVKSICSEAESSRIVPLDMFVTSCVPVVVTDLAHYFNDFDNATVDPCMNNLVGAWDLLSSQSGDAAYSGGYSLYASELDATDMATIEFPVFDFSELPEGAEFTFYQRSPDFPASSVNTLELIYRTTGSEWTVAETFGTTGNTWVRRYVSLPASANAGEYHVALRYTSDTLMQYSDQTFLRIDNIEVRPTPECFRPINLTLRSVDDRTAVIGWTGQSDSYRVQYRIVGDWSWQSLVTEEDTAILTGFTMNTLCEVRVRGAESQQCEWSDVLRFTTTMCADHNEGYSYSADATTGTTSIAPFDNLNYCSYSEVLVPAEQLGDLTTISSFAFKVSDAAAGTTMGNCQVYFGTTTATSLSSFLFNENFQLVYEGNLGFDSEGWKTFVLQNEYEWDGQSNLVVGVMAMSSNYSYESSEFYAHQAPANRVYAGYSYSQFTPANANNLPLYAKQASNMVPDYYFVGCNPVCYEPVVVSQQTTPHSITLGILDEGYTYEMQIKEHDAADWNDPVYVQDTNRYTFNQLDNMTVYDIRLRHDCSVASIGVTDWVELTIATDTACTIPTGLAVSGVGASTATFTWTPGQVESVWDVHVWNDSFNHIYTSTATTLTVTDLPLGETFYAAVRARCGSNNHNVGDYGDEIVFNNICGPVTNVSASNNQGTVTLVWTAGSANNSWVVSYGYAGFDLNHQLGYVTVNTPSAIIPNLPYGHNYGFRVRAVCGDNWNSPWNANEVQVNYGGVGIDGVENATVAVYPNPATNVATVCLTGVEGEVTMTIVSIEGRTVHTERFNCGADCLKTTDVSGLAAGTYFVRLQAAEWNSVQKLVVK